MYNRKTVFTFIINIFLFLCALTFIVPLLYIAAISFSSSASIDSFGYSFIPKEFSLSAYKSIFHNPLQLLSAYRVTLFSAIFGGVLSVLVMALIAYPLSRRDFIFRRPMTYIIFFTMLFGGGLVPSYILNTQYLNLGDSIWIYIFPSLASAWYIIVMRTFFSQLPVSLIESAKVDGAGEGRIFLSIIIPLSKPVLATVFLMVALSRWNDWFVSLVYIRDSSLYTLQYMLQRILYESEFVSMASQNGINVQLSDKVVNEPLRFAMVVMTAGPMLVIYPFFQKYFSMGLTIGSIKE